MGAYLSQPITEKVSSDHTGRDLICGASSMQGWRMSQEDAHNCEIGFDEDASLFAVYDGHGGHEVAAYCSENLPEYIKQTEAYKRGDMKQALIDAFLGFDATLVSPEIVSILKEIAASKLPAVQKPVEDDDSDVEENVNNLCAEAIMPLGEVIAKYQEELMNPCLRKLNNEKSTSLSQIPSPFLLRSRRFYKDKGACSSSGAGCSTSSSSWNTNEADVSSSSQPCELSSSSSNRKVVDSAGSSEADQVLDSTTSNGDVPRTSQVGSSADAEAAKISSEMPDSSEDIDDNVSPSKASHSSCSSNEAEINGEKPSKSFEAADSSKSSTSDNECSSSCAPLENGEAEQQEKISSSGRRRIQVTSDFYKDLLNREVDDSDDDDDDDDDEDDNFEGHPESDDDEDEENDSNADDDEDDDDDDDEDDEDEIDTAGNEEPGVDSGCTAVVAILKDKTLYVANAGDSRCVLCRNGKAIELSFDHKPEDQPEMERIVKAGGKVTNDGRVNGGLNLSRALGDHAYKKNKVLPPEEQMITALPDVKTIELHPDDEFMILACDGIWNFMQSQPAVTFIRQRLMNGYNQLSKICEELFDHCLAPTTLGDGTGCDNMTAIIVQFKPIKQASIDRNLPLQNLSYSSDDEPRTSEATSEVAPDTNKRPANDLVEEETEKTEENVIDECKRFKTC